MNNQSFSPLSAAEMAVIWKQYMNDKELFLGSYFDEKRPLTVIEISHLVSSIQTNLIAKDLILGFAQTASSQEI